ncbi:hypothetical protein BVRB_7g170880 [Beta vulgaris subsp. vulgaris]|nr:hypothetical protein BVRB_7g170880 [Beta vulgaris subsp. vulgaris]
MYFGGGRWEKKHGMFHLINESLISASLAYKLKSIIDAMRNSQKHLYPITT